MYILGIVVSIALGSMFIAGTFGPGTNTIILSYLPLIIHQIVGWALIGTTIWGVIAAVIKR